MLATALFLALAQGCVVYEYEHEFWLEVDGSGTVHITGRPDLWRIFKGLDAHEQSLEQAARGLLESSGLELRRVRLTHRGGQPYLFVSADFDDINRLPSTPAFPDLDLRFVPDQDRLRLAGSWGLPFRPGEVGADRDGLAAVRFHLPSRVYAHHNAFAGVERGNIVSWREEVGRARGGSRLEFGALIGRQSILSSTVLLFAVSIAAGLGVVALLVYLTFRKGHRDRKHAEV